MYQLPSRGVPFHGQSTMKGFPMSGVMFRKSGVRGGDCYLSMAGATGFLRAALPQSTAKQVAHLIGAPAKTVEKWFSGETAMSSEYLAALVCVFGPAFAAAAMPQAHWAREAALDADIITHSNRLAEAIRKRLAA